MQRKKFIQNSLLAGASVFAAGSAQAASDKKKSTQTADQPFHLNYGIHDGMFRNSAGDDFIDQLKFAYDHGFRSMEDNGMPGRPAEQQKKIGDAMAKLGMSMGVFVLDKGG